MANEPKKYSRSDIIKKINLSRGRFKARTFNPNNVSYTPVYQPYGNGNYDEDNGAEPEQSVLGDQNVNSDEVSDNSVNSGKNPVNSGKKNKGSVENESDKTNKKIAKAVINRIPGVYGKIASLANKISGGALSKKLGEAIGELKKLTSGDLSFIFKQVLIRVFLLIIILLASIVIFLIIFYNLCNYNALYRVADFLLGGKTMCNSVYNSDGVNNNTGTNVNTQNTVNGN